MITDRVSTAVTRQPDAAITPIGVTPMVNRLCSTTVARLRTHAWTLVVWSAMSAWAAVLFVEVRSAYFDFRLRRFDLGNMVQAVWSTAEGRPLETTLASGEQASRLGSHADPILALLAPLWMLAPTPLLLAGVQIGAVALGALPVFWLARRHLRSDGLAAAIVLGYLVYPWLGWTALDAFHPVTLGIPLLLFAVWFLDSDRLWAFSMCAVLVAATGELMALGIVGLGVWYWIARGRRRSGLAIAFAGTAWTVLAVKVVVPAFGGGESPFYHHFDAVGGSPEGVVRTALTAPDEILASLTTSADFLYVLWLGAPFLGAFLLSPGLAAVALPQLAVNALAGLPTATDPRHHYIAGIVPFLVAATVIGLRRLSRTRVALATALLVLLSVEFALFMGPWPMTQSWRHLWLGVGRNFTEVYVNRELPQTHVAALRKAVALVPPDASVSATNRAGSHLSARRSFYSVPVVGPDTAWVVLDTWDPWMPPAVSRAAGLHPQLLAAFRDRIEASPAWKEVFEQDGVLVFRRRAPLEQRV